MAIVYHTRADLSTVFLFFHGDRAALAPAGIEIGLVHRLIGTHPHIVFLALGELGNGLGGGLGTLYSHGLVALFEVYTGIKENLAKQPASEKIRTRLAEVEDILHYNELALQFYV